MSVSEALAGLTSGWAAFYADSAATRTLVTFAHVGGLLAGGGLAVATDRATLRAVRLAPADQQRHLAALRASHRTVVVALAAIVVSGILLLASDVEAYWASRVYWMKMGGFIVLLVNGQLMLRGAAAADRGAPHGWLTLRRTAAASVLLWFAVTLLGVALPNV